MNKSALQIVEHVTHTQILTDYMVGPKGESATAHNHDDRYYTEAEINTQQAAQDTAIATETTARQAADNALDARIDALEAADPLGVLNQMLQPVTATVDPGNIRRYTFSAIYRATARVYLDDVPQVPTEGYTMPTGGNELTFTFDPAGTVRVEGVLK